MPRVPRIQYENAVYHIMARGDRREPIALDDEDRRTFVRTLAEAVKRAGWEVFAWVLMDNHYHLALRTPQPNLVQGMTWFQNAYTRRFNVRHRLWGHLYGGRYKAIPVESDCRYAPRHRRSYLLTLMDYIHLNPARAGIVDGVEKSLLDYPWSSLARSYAKPPGKREKWVAVIGGLERFGLRDTVRERRNFIERLDARAASETTGRAGLVSLDGQSLQSTLRRGWYWGSQEFRERLLEAFGESASRKSNRDDRSSPMVKDHSEAGAEKLIEMACEHFGLDEEDLRNPVRGDDRRAATAWAICRKTTQPQAWIAQRLDLRSRANVSQTVRRFESKPDRDLTQKIRRWKILHIVD